MFSPVKIHKKVYFLHGEYVLLGFRTVSVASINVVAVENKLKLFTMFNICKLYTNLCFILYCFFFLHSANRHWTKMLLYS